MPAEVVNKILFPARAGVILLPVERLVNIDTLPRTRGGDPRINNLTGDETTSSPHTRG